MEIYNKLKDLIGDILPYYKNKEFLNIVLKRTDYSDEFKQIVFSKPELSLKILQRYTDITNNFIVNDKTLSQLLECVSIKLIIKKDSEKKRLFIQIDDQIYNYLTSENFFQRCYDEKGICNIEITKQDVIDYKKENPSNILNQEIFKFRKNQLEVKKHLETNGIITGIHCESTGCGKSIEILMYINHVYKSNSKCKIILFTERVNILADLFDFEKKINPIDLVNIKVWKDKGICDLTEFEIIDRVTVKKSDWINLLNKSTKPTLLVINRAYLTISKEYEKINQLNLILHDECHNVVSNKCFEFLKYLKSKNFVQTNKKVFNVPIIGFSATPMRAGKTKTGIETVYNRDRLLEIYGINNQLNLITNYNMIYAISEKLILPPKFYWFNIDSYQTKGKYNKDNKNEIKNNKDNKKEQISKSELGSVMKILDELVPLMPNKKLVSWCGTIPLCDEWYDKFNEYKEMYENLKNIKIYKDYSKKINNDNIEGYELFKQINNDGIMFCAQKHREGSDIKKLDGCIFLDKVKSRGAIPFIQSIGRVLRIDLTNNLKTCGFIIDGVVRDDEEYEKNIVDKILGYYFALSDLANIDDICSNPQESNYNKYIKLRDLVEFDPEEKKIKLKLDKTWIEINCKKLDWGNIVKNFDSILEKKVGLNQDDILKGEFENLKKIAYELKNKINHNIVDEWKIYAKKENLPIEPNKKFIIFWKGWYDFYQFDIDKFPKTKIEWLKKCKKYNLNYKNYKRKYFKFDNLPEIPEEIYKDFKNFKIELDYQKKVNKLECSDNFV